MPSYPSVEEFVVYWQVSKTATEASQRLISAGYATMNVTEVGFWAEKLRSLGVNLQNLPVGPSLKLYLFMR